MNDPEPPLSWWRVLEFLVFLALLLVILTPWALGLLERAWGKKPPGTW